MRRIAAAALAASLSLPALAQSPYPAAATLHALPAPAGTARLVMPGPARALAGLVILLPDALGEEGRSEPYVAALEAQGIASLVLGLDNDPDAALAPADPAASAAALAVARSWVAAALPELVPAGRIGVLGFGAGGRAALAAPEAGPTVALYPGCRGLDVSPGRPVLLLHGALAPDASACNALAAPPAAAIRRMPGLGHAWDARQSALSGADRLPDPAGGGRIPARPDAAGADHAAHVAAEWFVLQWAMRQAVPR